MNFGIDPVDIAGLKKEPDCHPNSAKNKYCFLFQLTARVATGYRQTDKRRLRSRSEVRAWTFVGNLLQHCGCGELSNKEPELEW